MKSSPRGSIYLIAAVYKFGPKLINNMKLIIVINMK